MNTEVMFSSAKDDWATPQWLFDKLNEQWHFDLDVCAHAGNAKCSNYFSPEQDGLAQQWGGIRVGVIRHMVAKLASGLRKRQRQIRRWLCCCQREQTQSGFTNGVCLTEK